MQPDPHLVRSRYTIPLDEQQASLKQLASRTDAEAARIKRYLAMPDLSRTEGSPLKALADTMLDIPEFRGFDIIDIPEVISTDILFDKFNFAADHPARSASDTYYVDDT